MLAITPHPFALGSNKLPSRQGSSVGQSSRQEDVVMLLILLIIAQAFLNANKKGTISGSLSISRLT